MAFISGIQIIHAPAAAFNNAGTEEIGAKRTLTRTKAIQVGGKAYPYISAQAYRYWLRRTLEQHAPQGWSIAPIFREAKVAYTDADPIKWADDDVFGYMRAEGKNKEAADSRAARIGETPLETKGDGKR